MEKTYTDRIMMNRITVACVVLAGCVTMFSGCRKDKIEPPVPLDPDNIAVREDRTPFHKSDPMTGKTPSAKVSSDKLKLHFFGWGEEQDFSFNLIFPKDKEYERVIIAYTMTSFFVDQLPTTTQPCFLCATRQTVNGTNLQGRSPHTETRSTAVGARPSG